MISKLKAWWNRPVVTKMKHVVYGTFVLTLLLASFEHQVSAQTAARAHALCVARVDSRGDLRAILFYVVDLSDVVPDGRAKTYTDNRVAFINDKYPALLVDDC